MRNRLMTVLLCAGMAAPAVAQQPPPENPSRLVNKGTWPERFWVSVNGGAQAPASGSFSDTFNIEQFVETGHVTTKYPSKVGGAFDGTFGIRFGRHLGVGVGVTRASNRGSAGVSAEIPHPFFDNQLRHIEGSTSATHTDLATHLRLTFLATAGRHLRLMLAAGPSFFSVQQTLVTDVKFSQTFPFDTATFTSATTTRATSTATGFHVAGDVTWMLGRRFGTGAAIQYSRASVKEKAGNARTISIDAGGAQAGLGLRLFF